MKSLFPGWPSGRQTDSTRAKKLRRTDKQRSSRRLLLEPLEDRVLLCNAYRPTNFRLEAARLISGSYDQFPSGMEAVRYERYSSGGSSFTRGGCWSEVTSNGKRTITTNNIVRDSSAAHFIAPKGITADIQANTYQINDGLLYIHNSRQNRQGSSSTDGGGLLTFTIPKKTPSTGRYQNGFHFAIDIPGSGGRHTTANIRLERQSAEAIRKNLATLPPLRGAEIEVEAGTANAVAASDRSNITYLVKISGSHWDRVPVVYVSDGSSITQFTRVRTLPISKSGTVTARGTTIDRISDPETFPIINAPSFTPQQIGMTTGSSPRRALRGSIATPAVDGQFQPASASSYNVEDKTLRNVTTRSESGLRVVDFDSEYVLNANTDPAGNARPITAFQLAGLTYTVSPGQRFVLKKKDTAGDKIFFDTKGDMIYATAEFEGGNITYRFRKDGNTPALRIDFEGAGTGTPSPRAEFVSATIGGLTFNASDGVTASFEGDRIDAVTKSGDQIRSPYTLDSTQANALLDGSPSTDAHLRNRDDTYVITPAAGSSVVNAISITTAANLNNVVSPQDFRLYGITLPTGSRTLLHEGQFNLPNQSGLTKLIEFANTTVYPEYALELRGIRVPGTNIFNGPTIAIGDLRLGTAAPRYTLSLNNTRASTLPRTSTIRAIDDLVTARQDLQVTSVSSAITASIRVSSNNNLATKRVVGQLPSTFGTHQNTTRALTDFASSLQTVLRNFLKATTTTNLPPSLAQLTSAQRTKLADALTVEAVPPSGSGSSALLRVKNSPLDVLLTINGSETTKSYAGIVEAPVRLTIPSATFTITKGQLDPVTGVGVNSIELGRSAIRSDGVVVPSLETLPLQGGSATLAYYPRNTYDSNRRLLVAGNTFGIYGGQVPIMVPTVTGVSIGGAGMQVSLGDQNDPRLRITNGQFESLATAIPNLTASGLTFTSANVGSTRALNLVRRFVPGFGETLTVEGGAALNGGTGIISSNLKVAFGAGGTRGIELDREADRYTMSAAIASQFLAGGVLIQSHTAKFERDSNGKLILSGGALLDFNPSGAHDPAQVNAGNAMRKGTLVRGRFALDYTTNLPANELNGSTLTFFVTDTTVKDKRQQALEVLDYALMGRHPAQNPLRLTMTASNQTLQGAFSAAVGGGTLNGVVEPATLTGARVPTSPMMVDFTPVPGEPSGFTANGVLLGGGMRVPLTREMNLQFQTASFNGEALAGPVTTTAPATPAPSARARDITSPQDNITHVGSKPPNGFEAAKAIDNQTDNKYFNHDGKGAGLEVTPAAGRTVVNGLRLRTAEDVPKRDPTSFRLEGKVEGGSFVLISEGALALPDTRKAWAPTVTFANTNAYTTYRLTFPSLKDDKSELQIAELELLGYADVTSPKDSVTEVGSKPPNGFGADQVIDNEVQKDGKYFNRDGQQSGLEITPAAGSTVVTGLMLRAAEDVSKRDPASYRLEGKNSGGSFTLISEGSLAVPDTRRTWAPAVLFPNAVAYTSYRLTFPTLKDSGAELQFSELQLLGVAGSSLADITSPQDKLDPGGKAPPSGFEVSKAVDNDLKSTYRNDDGAGSGLEVTPAAGSTVVTGFALGTADNEKSDPVSYRLEGKAAGGNFTLVSEGELALPKDRETLSAPILLANATAYTTYRLTFPKLNTAGEPLQISELQLYGVAAPGSPSPSASGSSAATVRVRGRHLLGATIMSNAPRQVGDLQFQTVNARLDQQSVPPAWRFSGPASYYGTNFQIGSPNNPQLTIGGSSDGAQLRLTNVPDLPIPASFPAPPVIRVAGLSINVSSLTLRGTPVETTDPQTQAVTARTYTYTSPDYMIRVGSTKLSLNLEVSFRVDANGITVQSFSGTVQQNTELKIGNATIQVNSLTVGYDTSSKNVQIHGSARLQFMAASANVDMTIMLGDSNDPGMVIGDGVLKKFKATVDGSFDILGLSAQANGLTVAYNKMTNEVSIYGGVSISTSSQGGIRVLDNVSVTLGNEQMPGIVVSGGTLERLDFSISGDINLFKMTASPRDLRVRYERAANKLQITGELSVTLAPNLTVTGGLPGEGLLINTSTGRVEVRGLSLRADSDLRFGVLTIKGLAIEYKEEANGEVSISAKGEVGLPQGLSVGGSFKIVNGRLDSIGIIFEKNPGILVAKGLINIYRLDVQVEGLSDLNNFRIRGSVSASVGPLVKFAGQSYAYSDIVGTIEITPQSLTLRGQAEYVGGLYGSGSFEGTLNWSGTTTVTFNGSVSLYGGAVTGTVSARIDVNGNVDFNGGMTVAVPEKVPQVGGKSLGTLNVELRVRPSEAPSASYARFSMGVTFGPLTVSGTIKLDFDGMGKYNLNARFELDLPWPLPDIDYSYGIDGKFRLFDGTRPTIELLAANAIPGSPHGEIVYNAQTALPDGTTIDLYADHDNLGNDGVLIASGLPYQSGSQTYRWTDMASFAAPGEPVYVYAVVSDGENARVYSDYSQRFNVAPGFVPTLTHPADTTTGFGTPVEFSSTQGNAITVTDPRSSHNPDAQLEVTLQAGDGIVDFSAIPASVLYFGEGSQELIVEGTAAEINAALDGLIYIPDPFGSVEPDAIEISVRALPAEMAPAVTGKIDVKFESIGLFLEGSDAGLDIGGTPIGMEPLQIVAGEYGQTPLDHLEVQNLKTEFLTGALVKINNFEMGKEFLELPMNATFETGIHATFSHKRGELTLTGAARIEDYERALTQVIFETMTTGTGKSLEVSLKDHAGSKGQLTIPLNVVAGPTPPALTVALTGLSYSEQDGKQPIAADAVIDVPDGESIQSAEVKFVAGSYVAGEDFLHFDAAAFNSNNAGTNLTSQFDAATGVLTFSGTAPEAAWNSAVQQVTYESLGGNGSVTLTEGQRYIELSVTDGSGNTSSRHVVIDVSKTSQARNSPQLTLSTDMLTLGAQAEMVHLDPELTLTSDAPQLIEAKVAFVDGYMQGDYELAVSTGWTNLQTEWDAMAGVLTIRGVATKFEYEDMLRNVEILAMAGRREPGFLSVTFSVNDGLSATESEPFNVDVLTAPFLQADLNNITHYTKGRERVGVNDGFFIEHNDMITRATVTISAGYRPLEDELEYDPGPLAGLFINGDFDPVEGVLTLTGTATAVDYEQALGSVYYRSARHNPVAGDRVLSYQVETVSGVSNVQDAFITVTPVIVPPMVEIGQVGTYTEDGPAIAIMPNVSITSRDSSSQFGAAPDMLYGAEVEIMNWVVGEDELTFSPAGEIVADFDADTGRLVLIGTGSFVEYETVLKSISYRNTSQTPTTDARKVSIRLLESAANGLKNQTMGTLNVVATPDPVTLQSGTIDPVEVMTNAGPVSLGVDDVTYSSASGLNSAASLQFVATQLPDDLLGRVLLADGSPIAADTLYNVSQLGELKFEPAAGGMGSTTLVYSVVVADPATGNRDAAALSQTVPINVQGVTTDTASEAYMAQAYRDLLHRNPDPTTLATLAGELDMALRRVGRASGFTDDRGARSSVVEALLNATEYRSTAITALYQEVLGRAATTDELAVPTSLADLKLQLLGSQEYFQRNNSNGYGTYVIAVYQALLKRAPTPVEQANGIGALQSGVSLADYVTSLAMPGVSEEDRQEAFRDLLGRKATFDDLFNFDNSSREALLASIIASDEYYVRYAMPSTSTFMRTHVTAAYESVGIIGDTTGGHATATLIAPQYVLVAAHTVYETPPGQITFTVGGTQHHIESRHIHPDFTPDIVGLNDTNDIAVLKLQQPVNGITPSLLTGLAPKLGDVLTLVGFGQEKGALFGTKREGSTPPVVQVESNVFRWQQLSELQNDADPGDSGAPLFATIDGTLHVVGIVSGGTGAGNELGDIGTNTRVDAYLEWIQSITGSLNVSDVAEPPSLVLVNDELFVDENAGEIRIPFMISAGDTVTYSVSSSRPEMFEFLTIEEDGGPVGDLVFETNVNQRGSVEITVTATAGNISTTKTVTITAEERNDPPTIDPITPITLDVSPGEQTLTLTGISGGVGETDDVQVRITDAQPQGFFSATNLDVASGGSSNTRTLRFTPADGMVGRGTIVIEVREAGADGQLNTNDDLLVLEPFDVHTTANKKPTLDAIPRYQLLLAENMIDLSGISDGDGGSQPLHVAVASGNDGVVIADVTYDPTAPTVGQLKLTPAQLGSAQITVTVTDAGEDGLFDDTFFSSGDDRAFSAIFQVDVVSALTTWTNPEVVEDVNNDTVVSPIDSLVIINRLNDVGFGQLPARNVLEPPFYDTNKDGEVTPIDALIVINFVSGGSSEDSEGEGVPDVFPIPSHAATTSAPHSSRLAPIKPDLHRPETDVIALPTAVDSAVASLTAWEASSASYTDVLVEELELRRWHEDLVDRTLLELLNAE